MSIQSLMQKVATPYAEALLDIAQNMNIVNKITNDLSLVTDTISSSSDLQVLISNPLIGVQTKQNILNQIFAQQIDDIILKFLLVLVERRRIALLSIIIEKYLDLAYKVESTTIAEVFTSISFTEKQEQALVDKIKIMTNSENVKLLMTVDSSLIAGFTIKIGSKVIDTSLSGKLKQITTYLNVL
uniref:ATP synthase CF1 subunit delta n=1 Tax=Callithamnion tetricum TaxID=193179 RepID=A0A4D6WMP4_9FLOR|nr:ATP synthase CF1 subunit delta [Callithamnion tetricum]